MCSHDLTLIELGFLNPKPRIWPLIWMLARPARALHSTPDEGARRPLPVGKGAQRWEEATRGLSPDHGGDGRLRAGPGVAERRAALRAWVPASSPTRSLHRLGPMRLIPKGPRALVLALFV